MTIGVRALLVAALALLAGWSWIDRPVAEVELGNRAFARGRYQEALAHYDRALESGHEPGLELDRGLALYQLAIVAEGDERARLVARAEAALGHAMTSQQGKQRSSALVALGNLDLAEGAVGNAIQAYRRALREDPDNELARHNLELALRRRETAKAEPSEPSAGQGQGEPSGPDQGSDAQGRTDGADGAGTQADSEGQGSAQKPESNAASDAEQASPDTHDGAEADGSSAEILDDVDLQDLDRKLDALERRSQALRRSLFSGQGGRPMGGPDF